MELRGSPGCFTDPLLMVTRARHEVMVETKPALWDGTSWWKQSCYPLRGAAPHPQSPAR